ncbi:MAG: choice-of-anchor tandem repeat GloVer-containing protein [Ginsengibacter sp.]
MKNILPGIIYFLACTLSTRAQALFGTTSLGGNGGGTVNKFITATNNLTVAHPFESIPHTPGDFIQANDGKLYGVAGGGKNNDGVIFSFDPLSATYAKLHDFDTASGAGPAGRLLQASDGKLYGMTSDGGSHNDGVIFSFDPSSSVYTKLKDFDRVNDGGDPSGGLIQASDGKLYGTTFSGGGGDYGVIFSFDPLSFTYTKLREFNLNDNEGASPWGSLVQASDGKLYGTTYSTSFFWPFGGAGVIFSFDISSSTYTNLKTFAFSDGAFPTGALLQATNGKLYGMTNASGTDFESGQTDDPGYGVLFSFDPSSSTYAIVKNFDSTDGISPHGHLIQASDGKLYGMTSDGGSSSNGVIFSFDPSDSTYTKLKDFDNANGGKPNGSLIQASNGKLYGMTSYGGTGDIIYGNFKGAGIIFSLDSPSFIYTTLKDFGNDEEGNMVSARMVQASNGKLYGMTVAGGSNGVGVIFSLDPSSSTYTKLKDFDVTKGNNPYGSLIQASDGKLYGMTFNGGNRDSGVIFSFDPSSSIYTKLKDFNNTDGGRPYGSLLQAGNGKLFGMTTAGGSNGFGVIFSLDLLAGAYTRLKNFDLSGGGIPYGSLIRATDGKLYGLTSNYGGNAGGGTIFLFDPVTFNYTVLKSFDNTNGGNPVGSLMQADDGNLYGMTGSGGSNFDGVIFSFNPASRIYTKLLDFDSSNGAYPMGNLMQANDGKLYGMTSAGGSNNAGVIFSFDPSTSTYSKLENFDGTNGAKPYLGSGFIEVLESGPLPVTLISFTGKNSGNYNMLSWQAGNEQNLNYYELQRSIDGQNFAEISQIKAAGNNNYSYRDNIGSLVSSLCYYRLKSVDKDGIFKYSIVLEIRKERNGFAGVSPNPFKDNLVINVESFSRDKVIFIITDISGKQLYKENKLLSSGTNVVEINETRRLSKGPYLLTIIASQQKQSIKIIKGN